MAGEPVWLIAVDFGSGNIDITEHCEQLTRMRTAHNELHPTINTATFSVNDLVTSNLFNATGDDLPVTITKDGFAWFVGQIRPNYDTVMTSSMERLVIECVDDSINLQERIDESFEWTGYKVCDTSSKSTSIVHQLLVKAGFALGDMSLSDIDVTITKYTVARFEDKVFWNELDAMLYEFGHVLDMGADGVFVLHDMHPTTVSTTALADSDTGHPRNQRRRRQRWEAVRLTWHPVQTFLNELVFSDRTGATTDTPMSVALANGEYYPPGADSDDIYSVYRFPDSEILDVTSEALKWDSTGAVTLDTETYGSKRADIKFLGGVGGGVLTRFDIRGTVIARDLTRIKKEVVYRVANTTRILEHKSRFIQSQTTAAQFASDKANYYNYSKFTYDFEILTSSLSVSVMDEFALASVAQNIDIDIRIVSLKEDEYGNRFATAEGISAYSLLSSEVQDVIGAAEILAPSNDQTLFNQAVGIQPQSPVTGDVQIHMGMDPQTDQIIGVDPVGFRIKEYNGVAYETRAETAMRVGGGVADAFMSGFSKVGEGVLSSLGRMWKEGTNNFGTNNVQDFAWGNNILLGTSASGEIEKSTDGGETFSADISNSHGGSVIAAAAFGDDTFVFGGTGGKISRSVDDGATISSLIANAFQTAVDNVNDLEYEPVTGNFIAGGQATTSVLISTDNGATWIAPTTLPAHPGTRTISAMGVDGLGRAFIGAENYLSFSDDGGDTWSAWSSWGIGATIRDAAYNDGAWLFSGDTSETVRRSVDGGVSFSAINTGWTQAGDFGGTGTQRFQDILVLPGTKTVFLAGYNNSGTGPAGPASISLDGGLSFSKTIGSTDVTTVFDNEILNAGTYDPQNERFLIGTTQGRTFWSDWLEAGAGIVEQGSHPTNGEWIVFSNGLQICWGTDTGAMSNVSANLPGSASGNSYYRGVTMTFPAAFSAIPTIMTGTVIAGGTTGIGSWFDDPSTTQFLFRHGLRGTSGRTSTGEYIAIGWA